MRNATCWWRKGTATTARCTAGAAAAARSGRPWAVRWGGGPRPAGDEAQGQGPEQAIDGHLAHAPGEFLNRIERLGGDGRDRGRGELEAVHDGLEVRPLLDR